MKFNIRDLVMPLALALCVMAVFRYFFSGPKINEVGQGQVRAGESFVAPSAEEIKKPLNKEIDFIDTKVTKRQSLEKVETDSAIYQFSSWGGTLNSLDFKREVNGKKATFRTVIPEAADSREDRCFLLALNRPTPYFYDLVDRKEDDEKFELSYQVKFDSNSLTKTFSVFKHSNKVDLKIIADYKGKPDEKLQLRLVYPSPIVSLQGVTDTAAALVSSVKGDVEKVQLPKINYNQWWYSPSVFGAEDRYFVHSMVSDPDRFVRRAFYKPRSQNQIVAMAEGPEIDEKTEWTVSFYFGPKEVEAIAAVDERLEVSMDYGFFAPICKILLRLLKWLYKHLNNFGWAIIAICFLMRFIMLPFSLKGDTGAKKRAEYQRKLKYIQEKYKDDQEALNRERMELIKKHGFPGVGGMLPMLIQFPIFIALSNVLRNSIDLYGAPFLWIPDLAAKDPYYVIPVALGISMLLQALVGDRQQRGMMIAMSVILTAFTANFASGLTLYIFMSTALTALQTKIVSWFKRA